MAGSIRDGKGHRAYRRKREALKRKVKNHGLVCGHCGGDIDVTLPMGHPMAYTADHPIALDNGGDLVKQDLVPMHNSCNARKGNHAEVEIWEAS